MARDAGRGSGGPGTGAVAWRRAGAAAAVALAMAAAAPAAAAVGPSRAARGPMSVQARYLYYWNHGADFTQAQCRLLPAGLLAACLLAVLVQRSNPPPRPEPVSLRNRYLYYFEHGATFRVAQCALLPSAFVARCVAVAPDLDAVALTCIGASGTRCTLPAAPGPAARRARRTPA